MQKRHCCLYLLASVVFLLSACSTPLPKETTSKAKDLETRIAQTSQAIKNESEKYFQGFEKSAEYSSLYGVYAERENWRGNFQKAWEAFGAAQSFYWKEVDPKVKADDNDKVNDLLLAIVKVEQEIQKAEAFIKAPTERRQFIDNARANYQQLLATARQSQKSLDANVLSINPDVQKTRIAFPNNLGEIDERVNPLINLAAQSREKLSQVEAEAKNAQSNRFTDWVVLAEGADFIEQAKAKILTDVGELAVQLKSLSESYSKTLEDIKADYFAVVTRDSYHDDDDPAQVHTYKYGAKSITDQQYDYFDREELNGKEWLAKLSRGWSGDSVSYDGVGEGEWSQLGAIWRESWPDERDDTAEYNVDLTAKYYHKYAIEKDGVITHTDWVEVDETTFEDNVDNVGMDLESKPFGVFKDKTLKEEAPAGLAYVGNDKYGQWQDDPQHPGDEQFRFWVWYGQYRFYGDLLGALNSPYYYHYNEWGTWRRDYYGRRAYYGEGPDKKERYGSSGSVIGSSSRFKDRSASFTRMSDRHSSYTSGGGSRPGGRGK